MVKPAIVRFGEIQTVKIGFIFEIFALSVIAIITDGNVLLAFTPIAALGVIGQPALQAILSRATSDDSQGVLQGVLSSLTAISMIIAPITMTWVFAEFTDHQATVYFPGAPFAASALLLLVTLITFIKISPKVENQT